MPTEVLALPPGTYAAVDGTPSGLSVVTLTVTRPAATAEIGDTITFTTNATVGATFVVEKDGVATATTGTVGTNALEYDTTGDAADDVITCVVTSGLQVVESLGVTLEAPASNVTFTRITTFSSSSVQGDGGTYTFSLNLSSIPIGDEVMVAIGMTSNDGRRDIASAALGGSSMTQVAAFTGTLTAAHRAKAKMWRVARPDVGGGTMNLVLTVDSSGFGTNTSISGAVEHVQNRTSDVTFVGAASSTGSVNTSTDGAVYGVLCINDKSAGPTFSGLTEIGSGINPSGNIWTHFAKAEAVAAATPRTITSTSTTGDTRGFVVLSVV
jgi:hypothetical protein